MKTSFDTIVVGAGPAGSAAAIALASRGWHVALLERQAFPRDKLCGEFISPEGIADFARLGVLPALRKKNPAPVHRVKVTLSTDHQVRIDLPESGWGLSRYVLDQVLFEHAKAQGAECHENSPVHAVEGSLERGFDVQVGAQSSTPMILKARTVIAATGRWSNVPRQPQQALHERKRLKRFIGIKAHFRGEANLEDAVELYFFQPGYCGLNRIESGEINLCALIEEEFATRYARNWEALIEAAGAQNPHLDHRIRAMRRSSEFLVTSPVILQSRERILRDIFMVGDAAGFLDPFSGDGISTAVRSASLASRCVDDLMRGCVSNESAMKNYDRAYRSEFRRRFIFARTIRKALSIGGIAPVFSRLQTRIPALGEWVVRQTRGRVSSAGCEVPGDK
ncbi:MAG: NAD(P)/FAD-dependent oxidoreductase [Acidobacteriia bacterium]|nr:NAD(P)/FAD-dependent oxidoreductase [Terriglobia bacterium]